MLVNATYINQVPINGSATFTPPVLGGMIVTQVIDCRNIIIEFTTAYNFSNALNINNWNLSLGGFVNAVRPIQGDFFAVNTTRTLPEVLYTISANV